MEHKVGDFLSTIRQVLQGRGPLLESLVLEGCHGIRLFGGSVDGIPGWLVDNYQGVAWVQWREGECAFSWEQANELAKALVGQKVPAGPLVGVLLKRYVIDRSRLSTQQALEVVFGECPSHWTVQEFDLRFEMQPNGLLPGIFLDQRENRRWVREHAKDRRVLNLFSYTGGFSVAAAKGGATQVSSVDISAKAQATAIRNFELNGLDSSQHRFFSTGALKFLERACRRNDSYDLIVADPPSFSRSEDDGVFSLRANRKKLWGLCGQLLSPGGEFFFSSNWQELDSSGLDGEMRQALGPTFEENRLPALPPDFLGNSQPIQARAWRKKTLS